MCCAACGWPPVPRARWWEQMLATTSTTTFPTTNPLPGGGSNAGGEDAFVSELNPSGSILLYSTYLGGSSDDIGAAITTDITGSVYLTGWTGSTNFITTTGVLQPALDGTVTNAFVTKLSSSGSLDYSTYLGGSGGDNGYGITVDGSGDAYVTTA